MGKYYEMEAPIVIKSIKNVLKIYLNHGKFQVFPRVDNTKHGIGKGATIDFEVLDLEDLIYLRDIFNQSVELQLKRGEQ